MRLSSVSMSETRSRSPIDVVHVFLMIGGVKTVSEVWALRLKKEAIVLTFLMIEDIVFDSDNDGLELIALFINRESVAIIGK